MSALPGSEADYSQGYFIRFTVEGLPERSKDHFPTLAEASVGALWGGKKLSSDHISS
jgi:hypothetical protein